jgi:hypothetical protein
MAIISIIDRHIESDDAAPRKAMRMRRKMEAVVRIRWITMTTENPIGGLRGYNVHHFDGLKPNRNRKRRFMIRTTAMVEPLHYCSATFENVVHAKRDFYKDGREKYRNTTL